MLKIDEKKMQIEVIDIKANVKCYCKEINCDSIDTPKLDCPSQEYFCILCDDYGLLDERPIVYYHGNQKIHGTILVCKIGHRREQIGLTDHNIVFLSDFLKIGLISAGFFR